MTNAFAEDWAREQAFRKAYAEAKTEESKQEVREAHKAFDESIEEKGMAYARYFREYEEAQMRGNACIDFNDCIWEKDIPKMVADLRALGIKEFTLSSTFSSIVKTAWVFQQNGCSLEGMEEIKGRCKAFLSEDYEKVPAFKFKIS
ncbi:DUF7698 family protein [Selenomonas ruminantium]|uniref:DUF7698 domain-containing protein n=1 Tax=Selenomonas ruminantium TaxID=971 RepID=A0A1I0V521_SELRU|nr:hypothetical protein [Selenomonas ruminantium]SFA71362.1 hypothetical protein SAMN05216587_101272 [Selenomonas ruminantium]